jgi:hypothetical protein
MLQVELVRVVERSAVQEAAATSRAEAAEARAEATEARVAEAKEAAVWDEARRTLVESGSESEQVRLGTESLASENKQLRERLAAAEAELRRATRQKVELC